MALHFNSSHLTDASPQTDPQMSALKHLYEQINHLIEEKVTLESKLNAKLLNEAYFQGQ